LKNEYIEQLRKEMAERFEAGLRAVRKRPLTLDQRPEILLTVALKKMG
jgi:hypothetical protein